MKPKIQDLLLPFYFGAIDDEKRTLIERELLIDSELLLDFLDLKRSLEAAESVPQRPSDKVWLRLRDTVKSHRRFILPLSLAAALTACLLIVMVFQNKTPIEEAGPKSSEFLFDSRSELPSSSSVF